jgi:LPXTG-site transpeptidase (sortase) family protein
MNLLQTIQGFNASIRTKRVIAFGIGIVCIVLVGIYVSSSSTATEQTPQSMSVTREATSSAVSFRKATSAAPLTPQKLQIPAIGVDANVEAVGVNEEGNMAAPSDWRDVSWYQPGFKPGERGNAVLSGHLDWKENKAVFWDLNKLQTGDVVQVSEGSRRLTYMVTGSKEYDYQVTNTTPIFGESDVSQLKLITCDGDFIEGSDTYEKRLIVTAQLIQSTDGTPLSTSTKSVNAANI